MNIRIFRILAEFTSVSCLALLKIVGVEESVVDK